MSALPTWFLSLAFLACCLAGILLAAVLIVVESGPGPQANLPEDAEDAALLSLSERIVTLSPEQRELLLSVLHQTIDELEQRPSLIVVSQ